MFWTDWGEEPKIERAEMDGSNRSVIIRQQIHWPNGLTIDYGAGKIYWTDAKLYYIAKANYDGSNREQIFKSPAQCTLGHPFALTLYENRIYWTDWKTRGIHSTNKNSGLRCQMVWTNSYSPMDIHAFEPKRQQPRPGKCSTVTCTCSCASSNSFFDRLHLKFFCKTLSQKVICSNGERDHVSGDQH